MTNGIETRESLMLGDLGSRKRRRRIASDSRTEGAGGETAFTKRAVVIYESMFGNTQKVANAIAEGLKGGIRVDVFEVGEAPDQFGEETVLLIVGGPTHAFGMSRPSTRANAAQRASGPLVSNARGVREWMQVVRCRRSTMVATFDTRANRPRLPGSAGRKLTTAFRRRGLRVISKPRHFWVRSTTGPLIGGELQRAQLWGAELAGYVTVQAASGRTPQTVER